ncbi:hypothetical protein DB30_02278 [Enhygromyxa salina]|uniref:Uncharacterized protein n=1 Tax=Enhygromyxa salina TaxID=215803 RepID=A0A0C2CQC5_9BACT|nr:hypothetical protein DB30_02278 [Enhygromyxa salina]
MVVDVPASVWALPFVGLALTSARRNLAATTLLTALALLAGLAGARYELAGEQSRGKVHSGPIIGVHPRQAIAVRIDGFGPHDIVVDDFVDPPEGLGYDPARWAERLELELHTIAAVHYADGPARARQAYAQAEVRVIDAIVPPAELPAYPSLLGVEVRSGTAGDGSRVEFGCPGQPQDPRGWFETSRACPRKYLVDGSTGLGLSPRWPGYTAFVGRDRLRVARWIGQPTGDRHAERRSLAIESGVWLLLVVLGGWLVARRWGARASATTEAAATLAAVALLGASLVASSSSGTAPGASDAGGLSLLAIALVLLPGWRTQARKGSREVGGARVLALGVAASLLILTASPLAGHGDALGLLDALAEQLARGELMSWESSRALAGSVSVLALGAGVGICVHALLEPKPSRTSPDGPPAGPDRPTAGASSERRHARERVLLGLVLVLVLVLSLRKPGEDVALLHGAGAVLIAANVRLRSRAAQLAVALGCAVAAAIPLFIPFLPFIPSTTISGPAVLVPLALASLACVGLGLGDGFRARADPQPAK